MNKREFVGAAFAGLGALIFSQKVFSSEDKSNGVAERMTEFTETRWGIPEKGGFRDGTFFIGKGRNIYTGRIIEAHPFRTAEAALKCVRRYCHQKP